ncbi:hypothetical protein [Sphingobium mellinum]|uniref:hypothetical protein n=1 Tax=Sphingobium mellinum TaxID=1387166 RepID=UPI0030EE45C1
MKALRSTAAALLAGALALAVPASAQMSPDRHDQMSNPRDMPNPDRSTAERRNDRNDMMRGDHQDAMARSDHMQMRDQDHRYANNDRRWGGHHRHCRTEWRHHHKVQRCWRG